MDQKHSFFPQYPSKFLRKVRHFLHHKAIRLANLSHDLSTGVHIDIRNSMEWTIYNDIFVDGDYDEPILRLLSTEQRQDLNVLDLGSNVGYFTLRLLHLALTHSSRHHFTIQAVEASSRLCDEAMRRLKPSRFPEDLFQISINHGLIGQPEGEGILYHFKDHGLNSIFRKEGKGDIVPFLNISTLLHSWENIDLLKCDIEGAELSFLKNYPTLLLKTRSAVFEFHTEFCDYAECLEIIREGGFQNNKLIRKSPTSLIEFFWK